MTDKDEIENLGHDIDDLERKYTALLEDIKKNFDKLDELLLYKMNVRSIDVPRWKWRE